jgi:hypothetical protein
LVEGLGLVSLEGDLLVRGGYAWFVGGFYVLVLTIVFFFIRRRRREAWVRIHVSDRYIRASTAASTGQRDVFSVYKMDQKNENVVIFSKCPDPSHV